MERVQRVLGWVLSGFCLYLLAVNPFGRWLAGEPLWISTDWITVGIMILTALTAWKQFKGARAIQIFCFVAAGIGSLANESQTVGLIILNAGLMLAIFYGWYQSNPLPKIIATGIMFFVAVYAFDKATTNNNFIATLNWLKIIVLNCGFYWLLHWSRMFDLMQVARSYKNELDKKEPGNAP